MYSHNKKSYEIKFTSIAKITMATKKKGNAFNHNLYSSLKFMRCGMQKKNFFFISLMFVPQKFTFQTTIMQFEQVFPLICMYNLVVLYECNIFLLLDWLWLLVFCLRFSYVVVVVVFVTFFSILYWCNQID